MTSRALSVAHRAAVAAAMTTWTTEQDERLAGYWAAGLSTAEIGRQMLVSKNAVIGRAHRLGLPGRASPIPRGQKFPRAAPRSSPVARRAPVGVALRNLRGSITRNTAPAGPRTQKIPLGGAAYRTCRYPLWDDDLPRPPRPAPFCDAPVAVPGCPWCAAHYAVVFAPPPVRAQAAP